MTSVSLVLPYLERVNGEGRVNEAKKKIVERRC